MAMISRIEKTENPDGSNYLFMIGIDKYDHISQLHNCVRDVKSVAEVLTAKYQFEHENLFFLLDDEATKKNIYKKFIELIDLAQKNDSLIIYFAGHGDFNQKINEGYWLPVEADTVDTYISMTEVIQFVNAIIANHILVISDSSFSYNLLKHGDSNPRS